MEEKKDVIAETKRLLAEIMQEDDKDGLYQTLELKIPESITFENVEWVFQFDDDEPKLLATPLDDTKKLVIEIHNTSTSIILLKDGNGKTFKIFAREKQ
jgi:hypothetical protein